MNCIIPFEKEINFNGPAYQIESIALEHEINLNGSKVLGNFLLSGEYKEYDVAMNTKPFNFTVPFEVSLERSIKESTLNFSIDNFTYELNNNVLKVNIDYVLEGEDDEEIIPFEKEIERKFDDDSLEVEPQNDEIIKENSNNLVNANPDYVTYHVHIVKKEDTLESICAFYKVGKEDLEKLNDNLKIVENMKLLIPLSYE